MIRPNTRVANVESKVDPLTDELLNLTLLRNQSRDCQTAYGRKESNKDKTCSVCRKPGCYASKCPDYPKRGVRCQNCGKLGHEESTCWSKNKKEKAGQLVAVVVEDTGGEATEEKTGEKASLKRKRRRMSLVLF